MGLTARRSPTVRARSRAGVAIVVVTSWFGALLIAAPLTSPAYAAPADPSAITIVGPSVSPDVDDTPTWTFTLPADDPGSPTTVPTDIAVDPSDTATATITTTHRGKCFVGTAGPTQASDYSACTTSTGNPNEFSYTPPALTTGGDYTFYVHDVETTTTTTTIEHALGGSDQVVEGPTSTDGSDAKSAIYTFDADGPTLAFDSEPVGPATDPTPSWTWTAGSDAVTVDCSFTDGTTTTTPACATSFTPTPALVDDGTYTLTVTATDVFGHATVITSSYVLQSAGLPGVSVTPTVGSGTSPTWTLTPPSGTPPSGYSVTLTGPGVPAGTPVVVAADPITHVGTYSTTLAPANNGTWRLAARAIVAGRPSASANAPYVLDTTAPTASILPVAPTGPQSSATPGWNVTPADNLDPSPTVTCAVTPTPSNDPGSNCAAYSSWTAPSEGTWTLTATVTDWAANTSTASSAYTYDIAPAAPVIVTPSTGNGPTATWTVSTQAGATVSCTVTDSSDVVIDTPTCAPGTGVAVTGTMPAGPAIQGQFVLNVTVSDAGGSVIGHSAPYLLDRVPPGTPTFDPAGSNGSQNVPGVSWPFTASGGAVTCQLVQGPGAGTAGTAGTAASCATPYAVNLPSVGEWWVRVTVTDAAGNTSNADSAHVIYDLTKPDPPSVDLTSASPTSSNATTWGLGTTETSGATFLCSWIGPGYSAPEATCPAAYSFPLPATNGTYTLSVVVRDAAGNRSDPTPGTVLFDDVAPVVTFGTPPATPRSNATVTWTTTVAETGAGSVKTECRLMKRTAGPDVEIEAWTTASCGRTVTRTLTNGDGLYYLQVRDTDAAGNVDVNGTASALVELDTTAPGAPTVTGSQGFSQNPNASWTINPPASPDPTAVYDCRLVKDNVTAGTVWVSCDTDTTSPGVVFTTTLGGDGTYVLEVVARDPSGNLSTPVATSTPYTLDRVKPAAPTVSTTTYESNSGSPIWTITGEASATFTCTWTTTISPAPAGMPAGGTCSTPYQVTLPADGLYTLHVTQTDQALNTSATSTDKDYVLDTQAPAMPIVTGPSGPAKNTTVQYTFTSESGSAAECRTTYAAGLSGGSFAPGTWSSCTSPWSTNLAQGDGRYRAEVRLTDVAKNVSTVGTSQIYVLDTTGPLAATFTAQPTGTANAKNQTWTWTGEPGTTGTCRLLFTPTGGSTASVVDGPVACNAGTYGTTLSSGDGFYQLTVRLTDPSLNPGALATSTGYTLDTTPPAAPTVSGPSGTNNKTSSDYAIVGPIEALATAECKLTRDTTVVSDWAACTMPRTIALGVDGSYVLQVRLTDQYGNLGAAGASPTYLLDTKLPTVPVVAAPTSPSSNGAPVFTFVTDSDTTTTCRVLRGAVVAIDTTPCSGGAFTASLSGQPDGDYVVTVTATDPATNSTTGASAAYTYDTTAPLAPVVTGPPGPSQTTNPVFSWAGEAGARPECSLQEKAGAPGTWGACASPFAPTLPSDGSWVLSVRLVDAAGNTGGVGQSGAYVFDTTAPATPVVTAPPSPGRDLAPTWAASTEDGSVTQCRLSGPGQLGSWTSCTLPLTTPIGADGSYTFDVRATDAAGNTSPIGTARYLLDTTAPAAPVVVQPTSPGRSRTPSVTFSSEPGTAGSCKVTHGSTVIFDSGPCSSPTTLNLSGLDDGAYTLSVRVVDAAGNVGPAGTATYVLDTTPPAAPTYTLIAGSPSSDRAPAFGFNAELGTTPSCKLTVPSGLVRDLTCASPLTLDLSGAIDGDYVLAIRAGDAAGNLSAPASTTYHLDSTAPAAPKVVGPTTPGSIRNPVWRITSSKPAECQLLRGTTVFKDWLPCGASYSADLFAQPDAVYILEARVIGTTAATMSRYRLDTAGPAAATIVGPPSPSTDSKPTWAVSSADTTVRAECRVMVFTGILKDWTPCAVSPAGSLYVLDLTGLGDGTYSLLVRLTDAAGNLGPPAQSDYVLDTSAPAAVGVIAPFSPGNDTTPTWTLTSAAGVKLECRLSSGQNVISDFAPCAGTFTADLNGKPDATYTLTVHALSAAGTPGPETTSAYILDTTGAGAPGTLSGPTGPSRDRAPKWTFSLPAGTTGDCRVTFGGKVFRDVPCSTPFVLDLSNAPDGTYTLTVRAIDLAGNPGAPSTASYILKTTPPPPPVLTMQPGSPSSTTDPRWGFSLSRGTSAQCRLLQNGSALDDFAACGTAGATNGTYTALLSGRPDGRYTVQVRAIDVALNTSAAVASDYVFDRSAAPLAFFVETPSTPGHDVSPTWVVAAPAEQTAPTGTGALVRAAALTGVPQIECRLTTPRGVGGWAPCSGRYIATTNGDGTYVLEVRAFDTAGERGPASSSSYLLDTKVPAAPRLVDPMPPTAGNDDQVVWSWADDGNLVQCHLLRNGASLGGFTACDLVYVANVGRLGEATYTIEGRAVDAAGNVSTLTSDSYRYDTTPPAAPTFVSRPPARGSASGVTWTFAVPVDTRAICVVTRNGTVISEGACPGVFGLDLRGQQPATWALSVHLVDGAGNVGPSTVGTYTLLSAIGRGRVDGPTGIGTGTGGSPGSPPSGGSDPTVAPLATHHPSVGPDQSRTGLISRIPQVIKKGVQALPHVLGRVPGAVPGTDVPKAIKNVLGQTITKPQLPLALFVIVLLFLLVQNRIDRRDPKLAVAPANAEPELTFGPILRPGGASA